MIEPIARIVLRWLLIPLLIWLGLPQETIDMIMSDPDVQMVLMWVLPVVISLVEGWYYWAIRRGRPT